MNEWETPERHDLRASVAAFTKSEIVPHLAEWEDAGEVPRALHLAGARAGLLGIGFPESVGGQGGSIVDANLVTEAIIESGGSGGLIAALFTHGIATPHIVSTGDTHLIDRYVRPTLDGQLIGSLAVTEPSGGSDVAAIHTSARREGDDWIVNGAKTFITSGVRADFLTTAVRTGEPGHGGISLLVIDKDSPGLTVSRPLRKLGWHCSDTAELSFEDVRVPGNHIVGEVDSGFALIMEQFVSERLNLATQAHATASRATALATAYASTRHTFGRSLSQRQVIRHLLVDMARRTAAARALTRQAITYAAELAELSDAPDAEQRRKATLEAVFAKNTAVEAAERVVSDAVQVFGGLGYMRESEVERHYRDVRILGIGGGATEVLNDLAAKLMGL
ncbi:MAG: acyl-CoA dehydrogenase family protein [Knoellia sp.]